MSEQQIIVTQVRSGIGTKTNTLPDRPEIRGMIARVPHLITVSTPVNEEKA
jgi:ribosomal protein L30/L7E